MPLSAKRPAPGIQFPGRWLDSSTPCVMGILNVTPDSFSDGGMFSRSDSPAFRIALDKVLRTAEGMIAAGASILDIGGESTRPGAPAVSVDEELLRVIPVVAAIRQRFDVLISVDTSSPAVITASAEAGAGMINDIRALQRPGAMEAVAATDMAVCLMHMQGEPATMQQAPTYDDVVTEVGAFLQQRRLACHASGIDDVRLCFDPGFGFGKTVEHNFSLLARLPELGRSGLPVLVGLSRKSMIGAVTGRAVDQRVSGSVAGALLAAARGAGILRVHDVAETVDALKVLVAVQSAAAQAV